jgi:hypothetical protein
MRGIKVIILVNIAVILSVIDSCCDDGEVQVHQYTFTEITAANVDNSGFHEERVDDVFSSAFNVSYRINRVFRLNFDFAHTYYKADFTYTETFTNLYNKEQSVKSYRYNHPMNLFSTCVGVIFDLGK